MNKQKEIKTFSTFDIETSGWDKILLIGLFDGKKYTEHKDISSFMEYIFSTDNPNSIIYAHFGGIFDFIHLFHFLFSKNSLPEQIILRGSTVLKFSIERKNKKIDFIDSSGLFPFSLEKLTHSFDVKHKKLKTDVTLFKTVTPELRKYLMYDCKGLHEALMKFQNSEYIKDIGLQLTRSSTSFKVYTTFFNKNLPNLSEKIKNFSRKAYYGGRTEIFKPLHIDSKLLNVFDINSLYPSVMHDYSYPGQHIGSTCEFTDKYFGIYDCEVYCPENIKIPVLGTSINNKYIFPTGMFRGHFCSPELIKAIEIGYKIIDVYRGELFENAGYIFKKFVNHFYNLRKNTNDDVKKIIYKDIMNHLYGRLAIRQDREEMVFHPNIGHKKHSEINFKEHKVYIYTKEKIIFTYSNPALAAFVTSYARLKLYDYLTKLGDDIYYCDTDSLFTTRKLPTSKELGGLKLENTLKEACFLLPKTYALKTQNNELIVKMKGFARKNINHINFNDFLEAFSGELRLSAKVNGGLARLKTGLKKKNILHIIPDSVKELRAIYDKRIIIKNNDGIYDTEPININLENNSYTNTIN